MTNEKKLELTLTSMLTDGLMVQGFNGDEYYICTLKGIQNGKYYDETCALLEEFKPLLHSLDKLTDKMFDGKSAMDIIQIYHESRVHYLVEQILTGLVESIVLEDLKKLHFNIYDLPKEMYIEKSILKTQLQELDNL